MRAAIRAVLGWLLLQALRLLALIPSVRNAIDARLS